MSRRVPISDIPEGQGKVFLAENDRAICVFRSSGGKIKAFRAGCPHKGCDVKWEPDDRTWTCPCHGAKFDPEGKVIRGPAAENLHPIATQVEGDEIVISNGL